MYGTERKIWQFSFLIPKFCSRVKHVNMTLSDMIKLFKILQDLVPLILERENINYIEYLYCQI